jgi:RimJ/RimL family protein N-acetyltransferase
MQRLSNRQRMAVQINTLYCCDPDGRLLCINEPGNPPAPRFFLGRTREGNLWRFRHDLPIALVAQLEQLCQAEPVVADLTRPPQYEGEIKALLRTQAPIEMEYRGPAYWISSTVQPTPRVLLIDHTNLAVVQLHFPWLATPVPYYQIGPVAAVVEQDEAVAVCFCSRIPDQATEAGVETVAAYRGRGYATAAVATWAAAVHRLGCQPLYSTEWSNVASQHIARKLDMVFYGEDWSLD